MITSYIKETQRLRSRDLLILTSNDEEYQKLLKANKLDNDILIIVEEHNFLNLSKGVIYSYDRMHVDTTQIEKELKDQKVVRVERIKRRINGELKETSLHIISFNL